MGLNNKKKMVLEYQSSSDINYRVFLKENNLFVNYVTYVVEKCFSYTTIHNLHSIFYIKNGLRDDLSNIDYIESFRDNLPWWTKNLFLKFEESNKKFLRKKSLYRQKKRNMGLNNEPWYVKSDKNYVRNRQRKYFK